MAQATEKSAFVEACAELLCSIDRETADLISAEMRRGDLSRISPITAAALRIILEHLQFNFPLRLPPAVVAAYQAGPVATPLSQCERCGYSCPPSFARCPLCGGATGVGAYARRRGRVATLN